MPSSPHPVMPESNAHMGKDKRDFVAVSASAAMGLE